MRKILHKIVLLLLLLPALSYAGEYVNKSGQIVIADLGNWKVESDAIIAEGKSQIKLAIDKKNMHAEIKVLRLEPFDVMLPQFTNLVREKLVKSGMEIIESGEISLKGTKAFKITAKKVKPKVVAYVVSITAFYGKDLMTISIADDNSGVDTNRETQHLLDNLAINSVENTLKGVSKK